MVYSAHLLTQLAEKPELDACLQVLLEVHRRNPHADPAALAALLQQATARYRTTAPAYIRANGSRDEILAAYVEALRQVPARTNFVPADLSLLNLLITRAQAPAAEPQADMIHSGSQGLLEAEGDLAQRQALLESCAMRAQSHAGFRAAMDALLTPEALVTLGNTPSEIITNTNSPLYGNSTMLALLALSAASGDGSLTVSSNQLMTLFSGETQTFWDTLSTNLALQQEINLGQPDLLAYLTNQPAINADTERLAAVKQGQSRKIAAATAAVMVQSKLMEAKDPLIKLPDQMLGCVEGLHKITDGLAAFTEKDVTKLARVAASGNMLAGGIELFNLLTGGESAEDAMAREIGNVKTLIGDLSTNMNYRFDRVDRSLVQIYDTLNDRFDQVEITLDIQGRQIAHLNGDVDQIRLSLLDAQTDLFRIERNLATFHALDWRARLVEDMNYVRGFEARAGSPMPYTDNAPSDFLSYENTFYTHAYNRAAMETLSRNTTLPYGDDYFYSQLSPGGATNVYAETLNYIKKCLRDRLGLSGLGEQPILVNPQDWSAGANAWLQLAVENPNHFRRYERTVGYPSRLDGIISKGRDLTNFFRSLTFTGTNVNRGLHTGLENFYLQELTGFSDQVRSDEQTFANEHGFALDTWRQWSANAPRLTPTTTEVIVTFPLMLPPIPRDATNIAAGGYHSLALKADGTVVGWGSNEYGQTSIPPDATNIVALAAGMSHSLALNSDRQILAWGGNEYGQTNAPADMTNGIAISAGYYHSLALRSDGTVVGWGAGRPGTFGFPHHGQATVPDNATNIVAIAAGGYHSLALRADGTLLAWGLNNEGQLNIPESATNVIAIAAGHGHNLVLKSNGTLVAWGNNLTGSTDIPAEATNIVAIAAAGWHCLAQRADGKILSWGRNDLGQSTVPFGLSHAQKLAAGLLHSLALKEDGTVVGWGADNQRQTLVPPSLTWRGALSASWNHFLALRHDGSATDYGVEPDYSHPAVPAYATNAVAIAAGGSFSLMLRPNGTVVGWGSSSHGQTTPPGMATNVVAVAAGDSHSLALRSDGTVVGWGYNNAGQATGVPNTTYPNSSTGLVQVAGLTLSNVVAIATGTDYGANHGLALRTDGSIVGWGRNDFGQTDTPASATNAVAIAAGVMHSMALRADGAVVVWGDNRSGQTNVPPSVSNVVAIAAANYHNLALRADGTVIGWGGGYNYGQTNTPVTATNVVAIAAGGEYSLALRADGAVVGWGEFFDGHTPIPVGESNVIAVAAGGSHSLALRADGSVLGWGGNSYAQATPPPNATNAVAIAAGYSFSLALRADGTVVGWGYNGSGQISIPASATTVAAIAAGSGHSLGLRTNGTVVGWGSNGYGQATPPASASNVVAIAAGGNYSLALRADGRVIGWGFNLYGQATGTPTASSPYSAAGMVIVAGQPLSDIVAIAAGNDHGLALRADGSVVGWGYNNAGQTDTPAIATNVVAIVAGEFHSLALRADGSVVGWGRNFEGQTTIPPWATNVIAISGGNGHSLFLKATQTGWPVGDGTSFVSRAQIPVRVGQLIRDVNGLVLTNLDFGLRDAGIKLSGSKALLQAVLELGMPYTVERDDVLHGFLYGSESLVDLEVSRTFLQAQKTRLDTRVDVKPQALIEVAALRYQRFADRLEDRLDDLAVTGQPEIPRLVEHTLRLLYLLRDAWATMPPPALETWREGNAPRIVIYGEPYARYTLQHSDNLSVPGWITTTVTNLHSASPFTPPVPASLQRFYRTMLPVP